MDTIVGNYVQNMTFTGDTKQLANGLVQKDVFLCSAECVGEYRLQHTGTICTSHDRQAVRWRIWNLDDDEWENLANK